MYFCPLSSQTDPSWHRAAPAHDYGLIHFQLNFTLFVQPTLNSRRPINQTRLLNATQNGTQYKYKREIDYDQCGAERHASFVLLIRSYLTTHTKNATLAWPHVRREQAIVGLPVFCVKYRFHYITFITQDWCVKSNQFYILLLIILLFMKN